jgi:hypothetical protein
VDGGERRPRPLDRRGGDRLLFDNGTGGTGRSFDWRVLRGHPRLGESIVAGGIGPANARRRQPLGAYAIDVGSAFDRKPGTQVAGADPRAVRRASAAGVGPSASRMRLNGRFGRFGGTYVPEILVPALEQLEAAFLDAQEDPEFTAELNVCSPIMPAGRPR